MDLKKLSPFLLLPLLFSCSSSMPQNLQDYLSHCSLAEAESSVFSAEVVYDDTAKDKEGNEVGSYHIVQAICFDFDNQKASHTLSSTYQGNLKIYDPENSFYLSLEKMSLSYDSEKNAYTKSIHKEGYTELDESSEKKSHDEALTLTEQNAKFQMNDFFFTSDNAGTFVSGGVYYADFFKNHRSYYKYMSIDENNLFVYTLNNIAYGDFSKNADPKEDRGSVDESIWMNEKGLLVKMTQTLENFTTGITSQGTVDATYVYR